MTTLISLPGGVELLFVLPIILIMILAIVKILQRETTTFTKLVFVLLSVFIPIFALGYLIYAAIKPRLTHTETTA